MGRYVRVDNLTQGTSLATHCRVAASLRDRTVGLLATPSLSADGGLLIERTQSIHMFFMRYPIDVVFTDRGGKVTRTVPGLRPWRVVWWARGARDCIELPVGAIQASGTVRGDQLAVAELD
jgi:uncharacterized membrane protein (UPF0127 family)